MVEKMFMRVETIPFKQLNKNLIKAEIIIEEWIKMDKLKPIIEYMKRLIKEKSFEKQHKINNGDFTRPLKITFTSVMLFVLGSSNSLLDFEILSFCEKQNIAPFSKGAMSIARKKVSFTAFILFPIKNVE